MANEESNTVEEWRPVVGYEGLYSVSNFGRVRRERRYLAPLKSALGGTINGVGYHTVHLSREGKSSPVCVHVLVAAAFIGPRPTGLVVNHKDGVKTNNRVENLEYITHRENHEHAARMGLRAHGDSHGSRLHPERIRRGEANNKAKLTADKVREIRRRYAAGEMTYAALAEAYGVSEGTIGFVLAGKTWVHVK